MTGARDWRGDAFEARVRRLMPSLFVVLSAGAGGQLPEHMQEVEGGYGYAEDQDEDNQDVAARRDKVAFASLLTDFLGEQARDDACPDGGDGACIADGNEEAEREEQGEQERWQEGDQPSFAAAHMIIFKSKKVGNVVK